MTNRMEQPSRGGAPRIVAFAMFALLALCLPGAASAQWATSGANISNTNTGNVGVGNSSPYFKLTVGNPTQQDGRVAVEGADNAPHILFNSGGANRGRITTLANGLHVQSYSGSFLRNDLFIRDDGNVGIGTTGPAARFQVNGAGAYANPGAAEFRLHNTAWNGSFTQHLGDTGTWQLADATTGATKIAVNPGINGAINLFNGAGNVVVNGTGNVGIGTATPGVKLDVNGSARAGQVVFAQGFALSGKGGYMFAGTGGPGGVDAELGFQVANSGSAGTTNDGPFIAARGNAFSRTPNQRGIVFIMAGSGIASPAPGEGDIQLWTNAAQRVVVTYAGNVGIGTQTPSAALDVVGNINVSGNINAKYQDVAEWVPSTQKLAAGTVVRLDPERTNHVLASNASYDTAVAGVISERPGLSLGEAGEGKVLVATTGRVKVKVDATRAPIKIGDLLVTSDEAGVAMKSEPVLVGGRRMHAPGTIIGKALEPLASGTGEILILLSLQ